MLSLSDFPQGFTGALLQNQYATNFFEICNESQRKAILTQAKKIQSKAEMEAFVSNLSSMAT